MTVAAPPIAPAAHFRRGARPGRHQRRRAETVLHLARGLRGDALDYGCGWGDLTARLAAQFDRMIGVDADPARAAFAASEYAPIPFEPCPADGTRFADESFDVVFSVAVLPFVPDAARYLAECRRVLRPGGALVIMIPNPESMWMLGRRVRGTPVTPESWGGGTRKEFRNLLQRTGFRIEDEGGFYDPPFDHVRHPGDVVISFMNAVGALLRIPGRWSYVGYRARRDG